MKQKNILGKGNRIFLFVLQQLIAVIVAISLTTIILNSSLQVGMYNDHVFLNPLEYDMEFEKSDIYQTLLEKGIRDAVRMSVIKSQLETDGEFDGNKEIDVTAYVNRAEQLSGKYVTAAYRLEDLLKWGKYGFEYTGRVFESVKEMDDFLASTTTYTQYEGTYTTGFHPVQEESRKEYEMLWETDTAVSVEMIDEPEAQTEAAEYYEMTDAEADGNTRSVIVFDRGEEESVYADAEEAVDAEDLYQTLLSNRYQTTDQKTPEELVSTWEEYYQLCDNIRVAATSLYSNYREYLDYEKSYSIENSNLLYCMIMMVDGKNVCFTNVTLPDLTISAINDYFNKFQNTIYYSPYDMEYHTTTGVTEDYFLRLMNAYNYAYTENTKIWIAVDDNYDADDVFAKAEYTFNHLLPSWWKYAAVIAGGISVWIALLVLMSWFTGRKIVIEGDEETDDVVEVFPTKFETIPTEIWLLICGLAAALLVVMAAFTYDMLQWKKMENHMILNIAVTETLIASSIGCMIFYSFIRRCKVHNLWRGSFTYYILKWFHEKFLLKIAGAVKVIYRNMPVAFRTLVPYSGLMLTNAVGMLLAFILGNIFIILLLCVLDAAVGWLMFKKSIDNKKIVDGIGEIRNGDLNYQVDTEKMYGENKLLAEAVNSIGDGIRRAVETSMKDEKLKADLITNVSHDIKTPLTSIINYVDLLKREHIEDEKIKAYIEILDSKSQRLKQLTDDLVEASKISSGNITLHIEKINIVELLNQAIGEFSEKFDTKDLQMVVTFEKKAMHINADSRRMWRVIENLFNNIFKYALAGTRVYIDGKTENKQVELSIKNISAQPLNINADELTERFIRGDVSRSTEGSGLGLSIAKNLTEVQNGKFKIYLDGDLFKAILTFPESGE
ncbi:MAG: HAMP domain-containing histidine kinase [Lachnospiraceae bacterium]|nr:HAMP domain-containing histidine kinase [Lachnospiraceae bacterium]